VEEDIVGRKTSLRHDLLTARQRLSTVQRMRAGEAIARHAAERWHDLRTVAAYLSIGAEPPTDPMLDGWLEDGVRILLPVIDGDHLDWAGYVGAESLGAGPLGINQPTGPRLGGSALAAAELVIVPALCVDRRGSRLGRGRGYYDRALTTTEAPVVAVVYDSELIDDVPVEAHDRPVDGVLRPAGFTSLR
jgi:5-formyltetrahydrofolate cyclo-ligase